MMRLLPLSTLLMLAACATAPPAPHLARCGDPATRLPPPADIWDDGQSTFLRFRGNQRLPAPYVVQPDGSEALVNYSVAADGPDHLMTLHQTAREIRLRDGNAIVCITNPHWTPGGWNPGTGTTSPFVLRLPREEDDDD